MDYQNGRESFRSKQTMETEITRKWVLKNLKFHGYSARAEAVTYLASQFAPLNEDLRKKWMSKVIDKIHALKFNTPVLEKEQVVLCLDECTSAQPSSEPIFTVISGFEVPRFKYDPERKKFTKDDKIDGCLFPEAPMKSYIYRYAMILQRVQQNKMFKKTLIGPNDGPSFDLRSAEWFLGSAGKIERAVMLGLLVQRGAGLFDLEDPTGAVRLDLSQCKFREGLITQHCFVLIEGVYDDQIFHVAGMANPPAERAKVSITHYNGLNTFGGPSETTLTASVTLYNYQNANPYERIMFLSDVWLDDPRILVKLAALLEAFENSPPIAFVLMGNFLSIQAGPSYASRLKTGCKALADMISQFPAILEKSHFVLVPGPADPGSPLVYPRSPLPQSLTEELVSKIPLMKLATNPCRIQYCTREIVVVRDDLVTKMCRNAVHFPTEGEIPYHFAKTIICNSTLAPMSLTSWPVYWNHSSAMDLYPLPDLVVIGDQFSPFTASHCECQVINPGSFRRNNFSFSVYYPAENKLEKSKITDDND